MYQHTAKYYGHFYNGASDTERRCRFVCDTLERGSASVVDVAAGTGDLALALAARGHVVTAFEPVDTFYAVMLERTRVRPDLRHLVAPLPVDFTVYAGPSLGADAVLASNVMSHLPLPAKVGLLREAHRHLAPGGWLIFNTSQPTPARRDQPMEEIGKRVAGHVVVRHSASSTRVDDSTQRVVFEFRVEYRGQHVKTDSETFLMHLDARGAVDKLVRDAGFRDVRYWGSFDGAAPDENGPGLVCACRREPG